MACPIESLTSRSDDTNAVRSPSWQRGRCRAKGREAPPERRKPRVTCASEGFETHRPGIYRRWYLLAVARDPFREEWNVAALCRGAVHWISSCGEDRSCAVTGVHSWLSSPGWRHDVHVERGTHLPAEVGPFVKLGLSFYDNSLWSVQSRESLGPVNHGYQESSQIGQSVGFVGLTVKASD